MFKNWNVDGLETMYQEKPFTGSWEADNMERQEKLYEEPKGKVIVHRYNIRYTHS